MHTHPLSLSPLPGRLTQGYEFKAGAEGNGYYKTAAQPTNSPPSAASALGALGLGRPAQPEGDGLTDLSAPKPKPKKNWKAKWRVAGKMVIATKKLAKGPTGKYRFPGGGKFNMSNPKSDIDWVIHRANETPSPSQYGAPKLKGPSGGKFNLSKPKTEIEW